jgi:hypothetical protein
MPAGKSVAGQLYTPRPSKAVNVGSDFGTWLCLRWQGQALNMEVQFLWITPLADGHQGDD